MRSQDIAACLARNLFARDLVVVDQCTWPGDECDLLVLTKRLQVIDVEIKISRADLKRDRDKAKWHDTKGWGDARTVTPRDWPRRVWKHYYAMPASLWRPELLELCHPTSGVIVVDDTGGHPAESRGRERAQLKNPKHWSHDVVKRAQPCITYEPVAAADVMAIARLASLRMWDAYHDYTALARDREQMAETAAGKPDPLQDLVDALGALPKRLLNTLGAERMLTRARHMLSLPDVQPGSPVEGELMPRQTPPTRTIVEIPARRQGKSLAAGVLPLRPPPTTAAGLRALDEATPVYGGLANMAAAIRSNPFELEPSPERARRKRKKIRGS